MSHYINGLADADCDLFRRESFKIRQLQNLPTAWTEAAQQLLYQARQCSNIIRTRRKRQFGSSTFRFHTLVEAVRRQMTLAIHSAMIRILQQPHFEYALTRIEFCLRPKKIQEDGLYDVLGFPGIADNSEGDAVHQAMIAIEKHSQRVVLPVHQGMRQLLVRQLIEKTP